MSGVTCHLNSQILRASDLKFREKVHLLPHVTSHMLPYIFFKVVKLVGAGSVIKGTYLV